LASVLVPMPTWCIPDPGGGIIDERTGALIVTPMSTESAWPYRARVENGNASVRA
jgi:hypothetical protein